MLTFYVYILSNNAQVLYVGMTNNLEGRLFEHFRDRDPKSFVARYNLDRLVYYEDYPTALDAIAREKQLKGWARAKKKKLIRGMNPEWRNLLEDLKHGMLELPEGLLKAAELILRQAQDDGGGSLGVIVGTLRYALPIRSGIIAFFRI